MCLADLCLGLLRCDNSWERLRHLSSQEQFNKMRLFQCGMKRSAAQCLPQHCVMGGCTDTVMARLP